MKSSKNKVPRLSKNIFHSLQNGKEELLSRSEELQSNNEGPASSPKKQQSTNEELIVLNQKLTNLEEQVTSARDYADAILTTIREPLLVLDKNLRVKTANNAFYKTFLLNKEETENILIYDLGNKQWNSPGLRKLLEDILPEKSKFSDFPVQFNLPHIGKRNLMLNVSEIKGSEKLILLTLEDITEEFTLESEKAKLLQNFQNMLKQAPVAICVLKGTDYIVEMANDLYLQLVAKDNDFIGKPLFQSLPEIKLQGIKELLDKVMLTKLPFYGNEVKVNLQKNDKSEEGFFNFVYSPIHEEDATISGILVVATEVTEHILSHRKIEESEHRYHEMIYSSISQIAILQGEDFIISMANDSIIEQWGKGKDVIGKPLMEILPELESQGMKEMLQNVYKTGIIHRENKMPVNLIRNGKGELAYFNFVYQPQRNTHGDIEGVAIISIEVTPQAVFNQKIKESREKYFQLLQNLPVAVYTCDADGFITYYNDAAVELWGRKPELGIEKWGGSWKSFRTDGSLIQKEDLAMALAIKEKRYENGEEFKIEQPDGTKRFIIPYPRINQDAAGNITGAVNTMIDITELKEAEYSIRQSEKRFRNLVEQATTAMAVLQGPEKILTVVNEAMLTIWDRDKTIIGKRLLDFMPEIGSQPFPKLLEQVYDTGKTYVEEDALVILERKGKLETLYMDFSYTALRNHNDEIAGVLINATDVTEAVIYKKQLEESEKNFRNIIEQSPVAMCVLKEPDYKVEIANERMFEIWGKTAEEVMHKPLLVGLPEVENQGIKELLGKVYSTGERFTANEYQIDLNRKGKLETIYVNFVYEALRESDNTISGIMVVAIDVTEQIKARKESEILQQQKDDFLGIASHELKTPVTVLKAYSQILGKVLLEKGNIQESKMAEKMDEQANKLNDLIIDLLDTTKINSGKLQFNDHEFDFNELVKSILDEIKYTTQSHSIIQELDHSCIVLADKERIGQVIDNFITNAIKYSPNSDKVFVRTKLKNDEIYLSVQDFGIGINHENKDKVFGQFYRVTTEGSPNTYPGIGLGLFIAAEIIKRENGKIGVESEKGKGASFWFSLPCKKIN